MSIDGAGSLNTNPLEKMRKEMHARLEHARNNPISADKLSRLIQRADEIRENFINRGFRDEAEDREERQIYKEIEESSAMAYNLPEFRILLEDLLSRYSPEGKKAAVDWILAHENAHTNVAQATKHDVVGYAILFQETPGGLVEPIPMCVVYPDASWDPRETLEKDFLVINAPTTYENQLSPGDTADIEQNRKLLHILDSKDLS